MTLYADNEVNDVRRIEQGVGQGFKFDRGAVPSAEQVMSLAGTVAREQIKGVSEEMVGYFLESAQELLAEGDSEVILFFFTVAIKQWLRRAQTGTASRGTGFTATIAEKIHRVSWA